jgi:hypothetical protein
MFIHLVVQCFQVPFSLCVLFKQELYELAVEFEIS